MSNPLDPTVTQTPGQGVEFRVIIRGLKLDDTARKLIDSAIRNAVKRELATLDSGAQSRILDQAHAPQTRAALLGPPLGMVVDKIIMRYLHNTEKEAKR